jgi:hypothetical protein
MALFTEDTHFVVYMDAKSDVPTPVLQSDESEYSRRSSPSIFDT